MLKEYWVITIKGWGSLYATGSKIEATQWKRYKEVWEEAPGTMRKATEEEIKKITRWENLAALLG